MSCTAAPHPRWLMRRPHCLAAWLQCRNAYRRTPLLWPLSALIIAVLVWAFSRAALIGFLQRCAAHPIILGIIAAVCTWAMTARLERGAQRELALSWLAALPTMQSQAARVALAPLAALALIVAVLIVAMLAGLAPESAAEIVLPVAAGMSAGFLTGWLAPQGSTAVTPGSWYARVRPVRNRSEIRPTLLALGLWPIAQARVWARPKINARWLLLALVALPLGTPAAKALAVAAAVLVGWHVLALLGATVRVSFAAGWWLAPTSIGIVRFTGSLVYLAWLRQLIICALALAAAAALGGAAALHAGSAVAAAWLALCCLSGALACSWALASRSIAASTLHRRMQ